MRRTERRRATKETFFFFFFKRTKCKLKMDARRNPEPEIDDVHSSPRPTSRRRWVRHDEEQGRTIANTKKKEKKTRIVKSKQSTNTDLFTLQKHLSAKL